MINNTLLHAAMNFWDVKYHVFRFNRQELCPLIEKFTVILGYSLDLTAMIALPDLEMQFPGRLVTFFDMPPDDIIMYAHNPGTINLSSLITTCGTKDKNSGPWIRTVSFYLYALFLLVSSHGDADIRIISILE